MNENPLPVSTDEDQFLRSIMNSGRAVMLRLDRELEVADLSGAKFWAIAQLNREPIVLSELARCMKSGRSNITQLVDRLEDDGLVRRIPHPDDRRSVLVEITTKGRRCFEEGLAIHRAVACEIMETLGHEERQQLYHLLQRVADQASS